MDVNVEYQYTKEVIPPRCRKPRKVVETAQTTVQIAEYTDDTLPVAFEVKAWPNYPAVQNVRMDPMTKQLYRKAGPCTIDLRKPQTCYYLQDYDQDSALQEIAEKYNRFILLNGEVWEQCNEPVYRIYVLGCADTGSTTVDVTWLITFADSYNECPDYFRADEYEEARKAAIDVATRRSNTRSVQSLQEEAPQAWIKVKRQDAIRLAPISERRVHIGRNYIARNLLKKLDIPSGTLETLTDHIFYEIYPEWAAASFNNATLDTGINRVLLDMLQKDLKNHPVEDLIWAISNHIVLDGIRNTRTGTWVVNRQTLTRQYGLIVPPSSNWDSQLQTRIGKHPQVANVTANEDSIEVTFYPECCLKIPLTKEKM